MDDPMVNVLAANNDHVLGQQPLSIVHAQNLRHLSIHCLIVDQESRVFIRQRLAGGRYPLLWTNSTGTHLLAGNWRKATAIASLERTLNLKPSLVKIVDLGTFEVHDGYENELCPLFQATTSEDPHLNPIAGVQGKFASVAEVEELIAQGQTTPHLANAIKLL